FFSSRRRHTRFSRDWSSDVCSSDLIWNWRLLVVPVIVIMMLPLFWGCKASNTTKGGAIGAGVGGALGAVIGNKSDNTAVGAIIRSEERRVGNEVREEGAAGEDKE